MGNFKFGPFALQQVMGQSGPEGPVIAYVTLRGVSDSDEKIPKGRRLLCSIRDTNGTENLFQVESDSDDNVIRGGELGDLRFTFGGSDQMWSLSRLLPFMSFKLRVWSVGNPRAWLILFRENPDAMVSMGHYGGMEMPGDAYVKVAGHGHLDRMGVQGNQVTFHFDNGDSATASVDAFGQIDANFDRPKGTHGYKSVKGTYLNGKGVGKFVRKDETETDEKKKPRDHLEDVWTTTP